MSVAENLFMGHLHRLTRWGLLRRRRATAAAAEVMARFDVRARGPEASISELSGGNQQKVVLARELSVEPLVFLLAAQPTRGLDVGAVSTVYGHIRAARDRAPAAPHLQRAGRALARRPHPRHYRGHGGDMAAAPGIRQAIGGPCRARGVSRSAIAAWPRALPVTIVIPVVATAAGLVLGIGLVAATGRLSATQSPRSGRAWPAPRSPSAPRSTGRWRSTLVGLGFIFANRANLTNVGAEGRSPGGIAATALALHGAERLPLGLAVIAPLVGGALAGALWGGIAGGLRVRRGTNEVISTLLLTFIALLMVYGSVQSEKLLRQPMTSAATLPESLEIPAPTKLPTLLADPSSPLHVGVTLAVLATLGVGLGLAMRVRGPAARGGAQRARRASRRDP